ncbi:hypothetical protein B9Z55_019451 [Caenorhabditis nigoni]|uniref:Methyltransferase FkbM domain-containing protein n=1 Tax=Caenorhabditis nigoni TaxID=1611254 RepID=A0A2G5TIK6_9PELO|nr:hypothetical protein B9Z55_019451 [Caenorhabditis nigoni]
MTIQCIFSFSIIVLIIVLFLSVSLKASSVPLNPENIDPEIQDNNFSICLDTTSPTKYYDEFLNLQYSCIHSLWNKLKRNPNQFLLLYPLIISVCGNENEVKNIQVDQYPGKEKSYWGVSPKCEEQHVFVTLGIGNDSEAIRLMKKKFRSLSSYGTSAYGSKHEDYDHFYNYAIGINGTGLQTVYGTNGEIMELKDVSVSSFFKNIIKQNIIDMLWINIDGGEFEYWSYFSKKGQFEKLGITVCQFNLEVDRNDGNNFSKLSSNLFESETYIFLRAEIKANRETVYAYFLNIRHPYCIQKYLR